MVRKALFLLALVGCLTSAALPQATTGAAPQTLDERFGADDGAAAAILFGANMRGNLDLCDCNQPRGGLARRVGFVEAYKKKFSETAVLVVEAGAFWYNSESQAPETFLQNDYVTRAYSRWQADVVNLGRYDLFYANRLLAKERIAETRAALAMTGNLIAANAIFKEDVAAPAPYLIKEVTGARFKGAKKRLRIGFLGLAEPTRPGAGTRDALVQNMAETARRYVPELRKKCDVLVIVAHAERDAALKLAGENPEADLLIAGNAEGIFNPRQVGNTLVVFAAPGNLQEGVARLYLAPDGKVTFKAQAFDLDEAVPSDPEALKFADEARQALFKFRTRG